MEEDAGVGVSFCYLLSHTPNRRFYFEVSSSYVCTARSRKRPRFVRRNRQQHNFCVGVLSYKHSVLGLTFFKNRCLLHSRLGRRLSS